jgi:hypothetical protein
LIELDGAQAGIASGLRLLSGSTVKGLSIFSFAAYGVLISGNDNWITGSFVGLSGDYNSVPGNASIGIVVFGANNVIGGAPWEERNVISGNAAAGLLISGALAVNNHIVGNYFGLNASLNAVAGNQGTGIVLDRMASHNIIGQLTWQEGSGNVIGGQLGDGVLIIGPDTTGNILGGNQIGLTWDGQNVGNQGAGVRIVNASGNLVGQMFELAGEREEVGMRNRIAYNRDSAVVVSGGTGNAILGDILFGNDWADGAAALAIDLVDIANRAQPAPVITAAVAKPTLDGSLPTILLSFYVSRGLSDVDPGPQHVEFFLTTAASAAPVYLGKAWYRGDPGEIVTVALKVEGDLDLDGAFMVATATSIDTNDTSELSVSAGVTAETFTSVPDISIPILATNRATSPPAVSGESLIHTGGISLSGDARFQILSSRYIHHGAITLSGDAELIVTGGQFVQMGTVTLDGFATLNIQAAHWIQMYDQAKTGADAIDSGAIRLRGNARLIVEGSLFEIRQLFSQQNILRVENNAQIIIRNSSIMTDENWNSWVFYDNADLLLDHADQHFSNVWNGFFEETTPESTLTVRDSEFRGTFAGQTVATIDGAPATFIEYVFPDRQWLVAHGLSGLLSPAGRVLIDESLSAGLIDNYRFTTRTDADGNAITVGSGLDFGIPYDVTITDSYAEAWGITARSGMDVTIRDSDSLVVTVHLNQNWDGATATFNNINNVGGEWVTEKKYNASWSVGSPGIDQLTLTLVNTTTLPWSPIVADYSAGIRNKLVINDSFMADNTYSAGYGIVEMNRSSTSYVRAVDRLTFTLIDTEIREDLVALGFATISMAEGASTLRPSRVGGDVVAGDNSRLELSQTDISGSLTASGASYITLQDLDVGNANHASDIHVSENVEIHLTDVEVWGRIVATGSAKVYLHGYSVDDIRLHGGIEGMIGVNIFFV